MTKTALRDYIARYRHKASVLTRIHSDLANRNSSLDLAHTCSIVVLTAMITFLGFIGTDKILEAVNGTEIHAAAPASAAQLASAPSIQFPATEASQKAPSPIRKAQFDFFFNLVVLLLFVVSLLNLIFRWKEKYITHFQGVVKLKQFMGWLDEMTLLGINSSNAFELKEIRRRYEAIVDLLPPNSDSDYVKAKKKMPQAGATAPARSSLPPSPLEDCQLLLQYTRHSAAITSVLQAISQVSDTLWLGGGSVRTFVWDFLTGRQSGSHDFDIVYFDQGQTSEAQEKEFERRIRELLPRTFKISVKNQARMHLINGEPARASFEDAISNWPEQATALAIRLDAAGEIVLFAPHGCADVLDMIIRPTPYHAVHQAAYMRRLSTKNWRSNWPEVEIMELKTS